MSYYVAVFSEVVVWEPKKKLARNYRPSTTLNEFGMPVYEKRHWLRFENISPKITLFTPLFAPLNIRGRLIVPGDDGELKHITAGF